MKVIPIHSKKHGYHELLVDDEDYEYLAKFKWAVSKWKGRTYALKNNTKSEGGGTIKVHRLLLGDKYDRIDHEDGNGLNNQRSNLRGCTQSQNLMNKKASRHNKSGFKGVWYTKKQGRLKTVHFSDKSIRQKYICWLLLYSNRGRKSL